MKKFLLTMLLAAISMTAIAQQVTPGFRMGTRIDLGITNVAGEGSTAAFGWGIGWIAEYNFDSKLFMQSGINIENIAHKEEGVSGTINALFAQLPIHVGYRFGLGETSSLFVQAGPTLGVGLTGSKIEILGADTYNYFDFAKRFDLGLGGRVGVEFGKIQVSIGANYGLLKASDQGSYHNLIVNLGGAYMF